MSPRIWRVRALVFDAGDVPTTLKRLADEGVSSSTQLPPLCVVALRCC